MERAEMKMKVLSTVTVERTDDFYKVVDQLNRTLKDKGLTFGFALDEKDSNKITMTIYEV
ncbi:YpmA family protein [Shouchella patagoniensis]|uniref:YpmA family protein n=1 Tax=Shouchella patagoniensis TaxID=228576 RepID=UPI00099494B7|nr:YpmA family protein [Shouchella patagoniensis]